MRVFLAMQFFQQALTLAQAKVDAIVLIQVLLQLFAAPLFAREAQFFGGRLNIGGKGVHRLFGQARGAPGTGIVEQPIQSLFSEAFAPAFDGPGMLSESLSHIAHTLSMQDHEETEGTVTGTLFP